jgi:hypothetical protein
MWDQDLPLLAITLHRAVHESTRYTTDIFGPGVEVPLAARWFLSPEVMWTTRVT